MPRRSCAEPGTAFEKIAFHPAVPTPYGVAVNLVVRQSYAGQDLRHRTLDGYFFKFCDFRGANLRGASLRGARFSGCDLRDADLRDTDLSYAGFGYVWSHDPEYGRTDVTGVRWEGATFRKVTADRVIGWPFAED